MSKPSKLKRAIKEMEVDIEGYRQEIESKTNCFDAEVETLRCLIRNTRTIIDKLKKIDSEKANEKNNTLHNRQQIKVQRSQNNTQ